MSEKTFKTYEVSYHIINKAKVQAKTKEEAAELVSNMSEKTLLDGSTLSIQHIWEPDVDYIIESELAERGVRLSPSYKLSMEDEPPISTDEEFPLGSL
tara:strand:+ start:871 stop:1164 length:294 start_codon:yes stop_codon:yes gene_type:complete